ncbi:MAG: hypothetical protein OEY59_05205 [Deltaproteobacteria bacterium]|nr:hypothetical protein [Deltaproteobacteria bacterium]
MEKQKEYYTKRDLYSDRGTPKIGWIYTIAGSFAISLTFIMTFYWALNQILIINNYQLWEVGPKKHYIDFSIIFLCSFACCFVFCKYMQTYIYRLNGFTFDFLVAGSDLARFLSGLFAFTYSVLAAMIFFGVL